MHSTQDIAGIIMKYSYKMIEIPRLWDKIFYFQLVAGNFKAFIRLGDSIKLSNNAITYIF